MVYPTFQCQSVIDALQNLSSYSKCAKISSNAPERSAETHRSAYEFIRLDTNFHYWTSQKGIERPCTVEEQPHIKNTEIENRDLIRSYSDAGLEEDLTL